MPLFRRSFLKNTIGRTIDISQKEMHTGVLCNGAMFSGDSLWVMTNLLAA